MNLLNSIKYRFDQYVFNKKLSNRNLYFIVSTGRTGTNFFESFLNLASNQVYCIHEPQPDLFDISIQKVREKLDSAAIKNIIAYYRNAELKKFINSGKQKYIESNPFITFLLEEIQSLYPKAKFLFIYRDIDTYLLSAMNKSPIDNGVNNFYAESDGRKRISASDFDEDSHKNKWSKMSRSQKITWYWNKCNRTLMSFEKNNPTKTKHISYEAFFSKDETEKRESIKTVLSFFDINFTEEKLNTLIAQTKVKKNNTKEKYISSLNVLTENEKQFVTEHTKKLRNQLGYHSELKL